jgi:hypothetical protein
VTQPCQIEKPQPDDKINTRWYQQQQYCKPANVFVVPDDCIVDGL